MVHRGTVYIKKEQRTKVSNYWKKFQRNLEFEIVSRLVVRSFYWQKKGGIKRSRNAEAALIFLFFFFISNRARRVTVISRG